jgi:preprotein translocase SecF subunit
VKKNPFKILKDKNNAFWAKFYDPKTKVANKGKWYAIAPLLIVAIGLVLFLIPGIGFNLGLDFTGGKVIEGQGFADSNAVKSAKAEVRNYLNDNGIKHELSTPQSTSGSLGLSVKYQLKNGADMTEINEGIKSVMSLYGVTPTEAENISASASGERILNTFVSIAVALIAILVYMLFRFKFTSGVAAVIALIHDVLVLCALCIIFRIQLNYSFVAALITVVVYSLNNTLVLFDRVRSYEKRTDIKLSSEQIVDLSVKETFGRTMGTTVTTLVPVIALCCLGVTLIKEFALPILFGLVAGTFSTIFITTALYIRFENHRKRVMRQKEKQLKKHENLI